MKRHLGSTIALVFGALSLIAGLTQLNSTLDGGIYTILGALAYRSAKRRKLGEVKDSTSRKSLEVTAILLILALVLLQREALHQINTDPVPFLVIPLWATIAYMIVALKKPR